MSSPHSIYEKGDDTVDAVITDARRRATLHGLKAGERPAMPSPADWRDVCLYFLMIDRFCKPEAQPNFQWDMHYGSRQGGTLRGVTQQLPYLRDLGITALWISPLVRNCSSPKVMSYHGYGAQDFLAVDEQWASDGTRATAEQELKELVVSAHALGIYVILDIVLNHAGPVFHYCYKGDIIASFEDAELLHMSLGGGDLPGVVWTNSDGDPVPSWGDALEPGQAAHADDAVYPVEIRDSWLFRRRGKKVSDSLDDFKDIEFVPGDFGTMRQFAVEYAAADNDLPRRDHGRFPTLSLLLRVYQYWVAKYDFDGFRIDTVKYVHPKFIQRFGTAMSEFAYTIGKKNFFIFGEVWDQNDTIASFVGRNSGGDGGFGIDAALDFPLEAAIRRVCTGPFEHRDGVNHLRDVYDERRKHEEELICSHGDASAFFVLFADNHDKHQRIRHPSSPDAEVRLCLALLYMLPGIPCLYYGTEQDLCGTNWGDAAKTPRLDSFECVREALWGKLSPGAWPTGGGTYQMLKALADLRARCAPLRYGRHYFRQVSGDGCTFGWSMDRGGVFAFSRIHCDQEVLVVATPNPFQAWSGWVDVDSDVCGHCDTWQVVFSTLGKGGNRPARTISNDPKHRAVKVELDSNELIVMVPT
jgi:hypothetical protein